MTILSKPNTTIEKVINTYDHLRNSKDYPQYDPYGIELISIYYALLIVLNEY